MQPMSMETRPLELLDCLWDILLCGCVDMLIYRFADMRLDGYVVRKCAVIRYSVLGCAVARRLAMDCSSHILSR